LFKAVTAYTLYQKEK